MAVPTPYQLVKFTRDCVQEKTHGIARKSLIAAVVLRRAGRDPMLSVSTWLIGVVCWKYWTKSGFRTKLRYFWKAD